ETAHPHGRADNDRERAGGVVGVMHERLAFHHAPGGRRVRLTAEVGPRQAVPPALHALALRVRVPPLVHAAMLATASAAAGCRGCSSGVGAKMGGWMLPSSASPRPRGSG